MEYQHFQFELPCLAQYADVARLATVGIARNAQFNESDIDDIKLAVSEACINVIQHSHQDTSIPIQIIFKLYKDRLEVTITDQGKGFDVSEKQKKATQLDSENPKTSGFGLLIMKSTMDKVKITSDKNQGSSVTLIKNRV